MERKCQVMSSASIYCPEGCVFKIISHENNLEQKNATSSVITSAQRRESKESDPIHSDQTNRL